MNRIKENYLYEKLLKFGFISEKIEPILNSKKFGDFILSDDINIKNYCDGKTYSEIKYKLTRNNNVPRILSIPHPIAYVSFCKCLKDNWHNIQKHFNDFSEYRNISMITLRESKGGRLVSLGSYSKNLNEINIKLNNYFGKKYLVRADISNFFPSLYSHSLPWALVGLKTSKDNQDDKKKWYNRLDFYLRNMKRGETSGISIGPDTSNIVSEIVLSSIDKELSKKFSYTRCIDDYQCYVQTKDDAQEFIRQLSHSLDKYSLSLNIKKTFIEELPFEINESWVNRLVEYNNSNLEQIYFNKYNRKKIVNFLDLSVKLFRDNREDSAIKYAIKVLSGKKYLDFISYQTMFDYVSSLCFVYPYFIDLFDKIFLIGNNLNRYKASVLHENFINKVLLEHVKHKRSDVVTWAIYLAIKNNLKIKDFDNISKNIIKNEDCIPVLMSFLYEKRMGNNLDKYINFIQYIIDNLDQDEWWLFIYELYRICDNSKKGIKCESFYKILKKNNVSFINYNLL